MPTDKRLREVGRDMGDPSISDTPKAAEPEGAAAGILGPDEPSEVALGYSLLDIPTGVAATTGTEIGEIDVDCDPGDATAVDIYVYDNDGMEVGREEALPVGELPFTFTDLEAGLHVKVYVRATDGINTGAFSNHDSAVVQD